MTDEEQISILENVVKACKNVLQAENKYCPICCTDEKHVFDKREIRIAVGDYVEMYASWEFGRLKLYAIGDGKAYYTPNYCPECGRKVNE